MKRKFAYIGLSFLAGLFVFSLGWGEYAVESIICIAAAALVAFICLKPYRLCITVSVLFVFLGMTYSALYTQLCYNKILNYAGKSVTIKGYITDYDYYQSDIGILTVRGKVNGEKTTQITFFVPHDEYDYYDEVEIKGKVIKIEDTIDFQSEQYNRAKGVFLKGGKVEYVKPVGKNSHPVLKAVKHYRDYMFDKINSVVGGDEGGFISAMLCGDKSELGYIAKQKLYRIGIGHIFAVSGIHLVLISAFLDFIIGLAVKNRKAKFVFMQIVIWSFVVFSGLSISVIRAAIMLTIVQISDFAMRRGDCLNTLGICAVLLTISCPYVVRNPSFLLSISGVFGLGVVTPKITALVKIKGLPGKLLKTCITMLSLLFVSMPFSMFFFDEVSLVAPLANIILVPVCTAALSLAVFVVITGGIGFIAVPVLKAAGGMVHFVLVSADMLSSWKYSFITMSELPLKITAIVVSMMTILAVFASKSIRRYLMCAVISYMVMITAFNVRMLKNKDVVHIVFIPDGKKSQAVVYKSDESMILDCDAKGKHNSAVNRLLEKNGITTVAAVMISSESYYTPQKYIDNVYPQPQKYVGDFDKSYLSSIYSDMESIDFENIVLKRNDKGFTISFENNIIEVDKSGFSLNGEVYELVKESYPVDLCFENGKCKIRRLTYGFDEQ